MSKIKGWLNKPKKIWSLTVIYKNRLLSVWLFIALLSLFTITLVFLNRFKFETVLAIIIWYLLIVLFIILYHTLFTERDLVIVEIVSHSINGTNMRMYQFKNKLFYTLDDLEDHINGLKNIDYIDLIKEKRNNV